MNPDSPVHPQGAYAGLRKRELFAAMAMQGIRAAWAIYGREVTGGHETPGMPWASKDVARIACEDADALIAELGKKQ